MYEYDYDYFEYSHMCHTCQWVDLMNVHKHDDDDDGTCKWKFCNAYNTY